jgi:hypothetical protein
MTATHGTILSAALKQLAGSLGFCTGATPVDKAFVALSVSWHQDESFMPSVEYSSMTALQIVYFMHFCLMPQQEVTGRWHGCSKVQGYEHRRYPQLLHQFNKEVASRVSPSLYTIVDLAFPKRRNT